MKRCLLHANVYDRRRETLMAFADRIQFILLTPEGEFKDARSGELLEAPAPNIVFGSIEAWLGGHGRTFHKAIMEAGELDWFQSAAAGVDNPALSAISAKAGVYTTNHRQSEPMAEWVIWHALDWVKRGPEHRANQAAGQWKALDQREIAGSKWLIVGYGAIGVSVGARVQAMGGHVTGLKRTARPAENADIIRPLSELHDALGKADIVMLSMPHTPETEDIANDAFFSAMKEGALFINIGRGKLVDENALLAALDSGKPGFAVLDVVREEPLPEDSPLWRHPKITITPHDSPQTQETVYRGDLTFIENLERYMAGEELLHIYTP